MRSPREIWTLRRGSADPAPANAGHPKTCGRISNVFHSHTHTHTDMSADTCQRGSSCQVTHTCAAQEDPPPDRPTQCLEPVPLGGPRVLRSTLACPRDLLLRGGDLAPPSSARSVKVVEFCDFARFSSRSITFPNCAQLPSERPSFRVDVPELAGILVPGPRPPV